MTSQEKQLIASEVKTFNAEYWYEVDRNKGQRAHEYFTDDGVYTTTIKSRKGHAAIREFYDDRQVREASRTSRHIISNERVTVINANNATCDWILQLHAANGAPVLPSEVAILIGDVHDVLTRHADGEWRYVSRTITPIFKSSTPTTG
jgi:ketosteroid isomerase-like protein